jgi:SAM-dependent methyltransferase
MRYKHLRVWLAPLKPVLESVMQLEAKISTCWASSAHRRLKLVQWGLPPQPEHFDHHIDLYYQWGATRRGWWVERGVFSSLVLRPRGHMLELACGDGFYARHFYSDCCETVVACDFDPKAIGTARAKNAAVNISYVLADIRTAMPKGTFDNIVWDAAIEHFTPDEIGALMQAIRSRLSSNGVLSGYTIVERADGVKSLSHHEYEFKDKHDLFRFLTPYFANVTVFETQHPERHNLYFWASDGVLPFHPEWSQAVVRQKG